MKIAKEFSWEMGHRLPFHQGGCRNLHGHSYKMIVELTGELESNGMIMDYYDIKELVEPIVSELDHSFIVNKNDIDLIEALKNLNSSFLTVEFETTAENLCTYFLNKICSAKLPGNIRNVKVKVFETETTYAEDEKRCE
jgi:6-pyruvoyltetrahydropterin/6-carboxytetrahydropterin synthase